jgi:hypothetical protein
MRFLIQSILVLFAGLYVGTSMIGWKSGRAFYHFSINSRFAAPEAAGHYWDEAVLEKKTELMDPQDAALAKRIVEDRFHWGSTAHPMGVGP